MKGSTTAAGTPAISIRVQAILGTAHRMQNPVSNAQSRWGLGMGRFYGAKFEVHSLSRKTWESDSTPDIHRQGGQTPYLRRQATF